MIGRKNKNKGGIEGDLNQYRLYKHIHKPNRRKKIKCVRQKFSLNKI